MFWAILTCFVRTVFPQGDFLRARNGAFDAIASSQSPLNFVSAYGKNCVRSLAPPYPTEPTSLGFGGGPDFPAALRTASMRSACCAPKARLQHRRRKCPWGALPWKIEIPSQPPNFRLQIKLVILPVPTFSPQSEQYNRVRGSSVLAHATGGPKSR